MLKIIKISIFYNLLKRGVFIMLVSISLNKQSAFLCESYGILVERKPTEEQLKKYRKIVKLIGELSDVLRTQDVYERLDNKDRCGSGCQSEYRKASKRVRELKNVLTNDYKVGDLARRVSIYRKAHRPDYLKRK